MKHRIGFNRLERRQGHRKALKNNMVTSLFRYERVATTKTKALEIRRVAEKMVTRARIDSVHNRRIIARHIHDSEMLAKLFTDIAPRYTERPGGYTRILKTGRRKGDAAQMVILEFVDRVVEEKVKPRPEKESSKQKAAPAEQESEATEPAEKEAPARAPKSRKKEPTPAVEGAEAESKENKPSPKAPVQEAAEEPEVSEPEEPKPAKKRTTKPKATSTRKAEATDESAKTDPPKTVSSEADEPAVEDDKSGSEE